MNNEWGMKMAKCYVVTIQDEVLVVADSEGEAIRKVKAHGEDIAAAIRVEDCIKSVELATYIPSSYDKDTAVMSPCVFDFITAEKALKLNGA